MKLMPNAAARELIASVDARIASSIGEAVREGVIKPEDAELTRTRMHIARMDKIYAWLSSAKIKAE